MKAFSVAFAATLLLGIQTRAAYAGDDGGWGEGGTSTTSSTTSTTVPGTPANPSPVTPTLPVPTLPIPTLPPGSGTLPVLPAPNVPVATLPPSGGGSATGNAAPTSTDYQMTEGVVVEGAPAPLPAQLRGGQSSSTAPIGIAVVGLLGLGVWLLLRHKGKNLVLPENEDED